MCWTDARTHLPCSSRRTRCSHRTGGSSSPSSCRRLSRTLPLGRVAHSEGGKWLAMTLKLVLPPWCATNLSHCLSSVCWLTWLASPFLSQVRDVFLPSRFAPLRIVRAPYFCAGDRYSPVAALDACVMVLRRLPSTLLSEQAEQHDAGRTVASDANEAVGTCKPCS